VAVIRSGTGGFLDRLKLERVKDFQQSLLERLHAEEGDLMGKIAQGEYDDSMEEQLDKAIHDALDDFGADFDEEGNPIEEGESDRIRSEEERERAGRTEGKAEEEAEEAEEGEQEEEKEEAGATA
jgi:F-type H+-transporting ATPase subunit alpha